MSKELNDNINEMISFLKNEGDTWDKESSLKDIACEIKELNGYALDEIGLEWDNKELMILDDFVWEYSNKLIDSICNVLKSFKYEEEK